MMKMSLYSVSMQRRLAIGLLGRGSARICSSTSSWRGRLRAPDEVTSKRRHGRIGARPPQQATPPPRTVDQNGDGGGADARRERWMRAGPMAGNRRETWCPALPTCCRRWNPVDRARHRRRALQRNAAVSRITNGEYMPNNVTGKTSTLDLSRAVNMVEVTQDELADNRKGDANSDKVWTDAMSLCQQCHIPCCSTASEGSSTMQPTQGVSEQPQVVTSTRAARQRRLPARFYDSIVMVSVGDRPVVDDKKSFRTTVYLPVLDKFV